MMNKPIYQYIAPAIWPIFLLAANWLEIPAQAGARLIIGMLIGTVILYAYYRRILDEHRAALAVAIAGCLWYAFPGEPWQIPLWVAEILIIWYFIFRSRRDLSRITRWANLIVATAAMTLIAPLIIERPAPAPTPEPVALDAAETPDIYLIVVDSYGRSDVLERMGYDNSTFVSSLRLRSFYVDDCSISNYPKTDYSLASIMNMSYIDTQDREQVIWMARQSVVRASLETIGYQTVSFETGFRWSEILDADIYLSGSVGMHHLNEFEGVMIDNTPMRLANGLTGIETIYGDIFRSRANYLLDTLPSIAAMDGPQFAFVHIVPPHPPFVFNADGSPAEFTSFLTTQGDYTPAAYRDGYIAQAAYIESRLLGVIDQIIETDPVIVIIGDHGPWFVDDDDMHSPLAAYYGIDPAPCGSHVNIFRQIFNQRFGGALPPLPNEIRDIP